MAAALILCQKIVLSIKSSINFTYDLIIKALFQAGKLFIDVCFLFFFFFLRKISKMCWVCRTFASYLVLCLMEMLNFLTKCCLLVTNPIHPPLFLSFYLTVRHTAICLFSRVFQDFKFKKPNSSTLYKSYSLESVSIL